VGTLPAQPIGIPPKKEGVTRVVCLSDTHEATKTLVIPDGDILIHAGDFTQVGKEEPVKAFTNWFTSFPHPYKIIIAGNHDLTFHHENFIKNGARFFPGASEVNDIKVKEIISKNERCIYLEDSSVNINGINIYGSPWQPEIGDWAFGLPHGKPLREVWKKIPKETDILITHGPPYGILDKNFTGQGCGCGELLAAVNIICPAVHIFGHIHEGYGVENQNGTTFINASNCNLKYKPYNWPIVFDIQANNVSEKTESPQ